MHENDDTTPASRTLVMQNAPDQRQVNPTRGTTLQNIQAMFNENRTPTNARCADQGTTLVWNIQSSPFLIRRTESCTRMTNVRELTHPSTHLHRTTCRFGFPP
ncbi:hypothetical protein XALC_1146 [Xanthomonas albilineans GPE PC73]|uniref:Uncharacterized protein n=1 Tax=Xanthomonas albilineans (strain GPE PC73 / CFBP 7063) TaxID=380358 RepID=D2UCV0_XANAP|nr:hypothetical protein XALC_1146 [Xanthomonas albilineans GPE PC73]